MSNNFRDEDQEEGSDVKELSDAFLDDDIDAGEIDGMHIEEEGKEDDTEDLDLGETYKDGRFEE